MGILLLENAGLMDLFSQLTDQKIGDKKEHSRKTDRLQNLETWGQLFNFYRIGYQFIRGFAVLQEETNPIVPSINNARAEGSGIAEVATAADTVPNSASQSAKLVVS